MFEYFTTIGLITERDQNSENAGSFLLDYAIAKKDKKGLDTYLKKMQLAKQPNGLYARSHRHLVRSVSHDEITSMMATSFLYQTIHRKIIWEQLKENWWAYPAIVMNWHDYLPYHPANLYSWGSYVGSDLSRYLFPLYFINLFITVRRDAGDVSSKLVYYRELSTMPRTKLNIFLFNYYESKMVKQYGSDYLMKMRRIYFSTESEDFPLFKVLK